MEADTQQLVEKLKAAYGERLLSVTLYGSGAAGDRQPEYSDFNVFCILPEITPAELTAAEPVFRWWRDKGNPSPLLMAEAEVYGSTDCFPMEFHDMQEIRQVLHGRDIIPELKVDDRHYRAEVEYELRTKLIRLRQKAAGLMSDADLLMDLMADSVATFLVLSRHVLRLRGAASPMPVTKDAVIAALAAQGGVATAPFEQLLSARKGDKVPAAQAVALLSEYMAAIGQLIGIVDRLGR